ncbi:M3 family oligoendopeptidase [Larsenimonas rhizosphaerae]|uniref:M3 family oligoendopeptidase n=1 Tax=Larsenimonas rhizosphaerae TaxID=2944682 RepID=UPI002033A785|nr:M3 family oligoendopeptidase [Larsenimonas rhizosphaerae]MCM2131651.1 oligoendopeptidase F family protein [Larsenimonas rhizosphaerae]
MLRRTLRPCLATALLSGLTLAPLQMALAEDTPPRPHWALADLYPSVTAWQQTLDRTRDDIDRLTRFKGALSQSPEALASALDAIGRIEKTTARLSVYAGLDADEDLNSSKKRERAAQTTRLQARLNSVTGYVTPELAAMTPDELARWAKLPALSDYRYFLTRLAERAPHILSADTESALAAMAPVTSTENSYALLANADIPWPAITIDGVSRTLDPSGYAHWRKVDERDAREQVFDTFWATFHQYADTFGSLLDHDVTAHVTSARLHHYDSALSAALDSNDIPVAVYDQLVHSANAHLDTLQRYLRLRQRLLGVTTLHYYDIYPPLIQKAPEFTLDQARQLTMEATRPLGEHYQALLDEALHANWTSPYPRKGKRSGAYMNGAAYDVHPYVLMNFNGRFGDVSTYAHEWGHGVHSMLATEAQPWATADYSIFTAEVASTVNEMLLSDHMMATATTPENKLFYIGQALESLRATFFRQTQFAEFEREIHDVVEQGGSLSGQRLSRMYGELLHKYYGVDKGVMEIKPAYNIEWAYVPHFYYNFYVYQYATSVTAARALADRLASGDPAARADYLTLLKRGGADSGYQLIRDAGVDLAEPAPYEALMRYMNGLIDQANTLLDQHPELLERS